MPWAYCDSPSSATEERKVGLAIVLNSGQQAGPSWQSFVHWQKHACLLISCVYVAGNLLLDKRKGKPRSLLTRPGLLLFFCSRGNLIWDNVDPTSTWTSNTGDGLALTLRKGLVNTWSYSLEFPFRPLFLESLQNFESGHSSRTGETSDIPSWFQHVCGF